ncbi:GNAT family N-acetyltransferase [Carboxylicivirga sp. M1479]|uniref:GNAT family N-acetyltransferase n=1 Tax=Carboxylicivirga sp. M1479 TaxID=2594476 RepID=UPI0021060DFD|nr:GNAT family protein [Carboxylicivirga sp. M1479]
MNNEELVLRALEPDDIHLLYQWENNMEIWEVSNTLTPFSKHQLTKYIEQAQLDIFQTKQLRLIIELENSKQVIGMIDLFDFDPFHQRGGVGIIINAVYRQRGFAYEALMLFKDYCFNNLALHQLYANISVDNTASLALFEKVGFKLIGIKKDWRKTKNGYADECMYQLIK